MDLDLGNIHVLVTGASGGIGLETAEVFLQQGAKVTAHYNSNDESLKPLIARYGADKVQAVQADLTLEKDVSRLFASASSSFGPVQVIVVNHGVWPTSHQPVVQMSLDQWRSTIDINLTSSFLVSREFLRGIQSASEDLKAYASILFIGSSSGKFGEAGHADYSASKSAMMYGLTLTLKNEIVKIAPKGRVNCIAPGWVKTPMAEDALKDPQVVYRAMATTPLKKVGLTSDIASQIVILSSPRVSGHISGEIIMIAGGMEGRLLNLPEDM
ncbi:putative KR domain containing protein [Lyophyllum shimeji]|uniref:KR domain containing protein n=1 Tax=Lyophyllum shimeji TaxID=47721 RepID=A0A9P3PZ11_LYOSH|nr:putative KR domain containing protein [Lyophyllum shimeji]